jgi:hypothetical protein
MISDERGPELMADYGRSAWWHNIALVQRRQHSTPAVAEAPQVGVVRTSASRRAELEQLQLVDSDFVMTLRSIGPSDGGGF